MDTTVLLRRQLAATVQRKLVELHVASRQADDERTDDREQLARVS